MDKVLVLHENNDFEIVNCKNNSIPTDKYIGKKYSLEFFNDTFKNRGICAVIKKQREVEVTEDALSIIFVDKDNNPTTVCLGNVIFAGINKDNYVCGLSDEQIDFIQDQLKMLMKPVYTRNGMNYQGNKEVRILME